jgi:gamma-glutamylcyclotransferase (GGCT)/AIG2-like uncharacterized protein YtfP
MGTNGLLFVYGTLKRGAENHRELAAQKARFVGEGRIKGRLFRIKGESYPGASPTASRRYIRGEVYELKNPEKALKKIDRFEGTDEGLYIRKLADVWVGREKFKAWTYFYAGQKARASTIPSGRFRVRASTRRKTKDL